MDKSELPEAIISGSLVVYSEPLKRDEGMTLQQVASSIRLNYTKLVTTKNKMPSVEAFLEYLHQKSSLRWQYDSTSGRYGKYFRVTG